MPPRAPTTQHQKKYKQEEEREGKRRQIIVGVEIANQEEKGKANIENRKRKSIRIEENEIDRKKR